MKKAVVAMVRLSEGLLPEEGAGWFGHFGFKELNTLFCNRCAKRLSGFT
jgi:hypothetical protein